MISLEDVPLHSMILLSLLDADGTIHYQSPSVVRLLGSEQGDLVGLLDHIFENLFRNAVVHNETPVTVTV